MKKKSKKSKIKRDINILKVNQGELNLTTRVKDSKKKYSRKRKHKHED